MSFASLLCTSEGGRNYKVVRCFFVVGAFCRFERHSMQKNFGCDFFFGRGWAEFHDGKVPRKIVGVTTTVQCTVSDVS